MKRLHLLLALSMCFCSRVQLTAQEKLDPAHAANMKASAKLFNDSVKPFLVKHCLECHGGEKTKSGFDMNTRESLLEGGDSDMAVKPGKPNESRMLKLIARTEEPHMPPKGNVDDKTQAVLAEWIQLGAAYDGPLLAKATVKEKGPLIVTEKDKANWAYRPLQTTEVPSVANMAWVQTPVDAFILAKLEAKKLTPATEANKAALLRRVTFDLTGLPPTVAEQDAYLNDSAPDAFEKVVDRLLASPAYGERWARHWLDPARYAESHGFEHDYFRPHAYHYRDFVIKALNADMPYDQFIRWQIAGDELAPNEPLAWMATGFLGAGVFPTQITNREAERIRYDAMDDMLATTGHAVLALTIGCARCHDHKYDPIPQADYYKLLTTFTTTVRSEVPLFTGTKEEQRAEVEYEATRRATLGLSRLTKASAAAVERVKQLVVNKPKSTIQIVQATTEGRKPMRHHTADGSIPDFYQQTFFLKRGDADQKDGVATQGFLQLLSRKPSDHWVVPPAENPKSSYRRANFANWLMDVKDGAGALAARVIVNRVWHHHMGRGIVGTLNDFGLQGDTPTHPELLEWLANDLITHDWSLKHLHKRIVLSHGYRLATVPNEQAIQADPENTLWHYRPKRRLEAEAIRDNWLAVSGLLDTKMYGPGQTDSTMKRRSIYFRVKRSELEPLLQVFDWPDTLTSAAARTNTTVAPQALLFLNNPAIHEAMDAFAKSLHPQAEKDPTQAITDAYRRCFARTPTAVELTVGLEYFEQSKQKNIKLEATLQQYAQVLFSLNEFLYID